jgi:hypothetical protein
MKKVAIVLDGGIVQNVVSEEPLDVIVIDYDAEGAHESEITKMFGNDAVIAQYPSEHNSDEMNRIVEQIKDAEL